MYYLLFAGYLCLFAWLLTRLGFFKKSGLSNAQLVILFLLKVMAGIFYGWIGIYYGQYAYMFDTWGYHYASIEEYKLLFHNPSEYFFNIFQSGYENKYGGFFSSDYSWWNDLKSNMLVKFLSLLNIFSFGNYYVNVIFYSFITFTGPVAIYRVFRDVFPGKKVHVLLATFLIPSFAYWTSGIHKDGLVFMAISLITYHVYFGLKEKRFKLSRIFPLFISFIIILAFRNFLFVILIPALIAWILSTRIQKRTALIYFSTYLICGLLFFSLRYIFPWLDLPQAVVDKQKAFKTLQGNSGIELPELKPTVGSFLMNTPHALSSTTLRPHPGDVKHILSMAAASETVFLLLLFFLFLFWRTNGVKSTSFIWFCIFFSFSFLLSIGFTVNFLGAIVRYRSIVLPFLFVPVISLINWERIYFILFDNIKNNSNVSNT
ncbi:MAG TPA: hypothetical protein VFU29_00095 [Chitinophagaceae bacterium]|nr:hypothetical protein [Chitinophagaceae bacterium]